MESQSDPRIKISLVLIIVPFMILALMGWGMIGTHDFSHWPVLLVPAVISFLATILYWYVRAQRNEEAAKITEEVFKNEEKSAPKFNYKYLWLIFFAVAAPGLLKLIIAIVRRWFL